MARLAFCHSQTVVNLLWQFATHWSLTAYYRGIPYLSVVDCGPGRFAIWRELKNETSFAICKELEQIFCERGPVAEVLMDNGAAFRSAELNDLLRRWSTSPFFRAAHRASGNGIVERNHRTIKAISERGRVSPMKAVFWYNMSPRSGQKEATIPQRSVHSYSWRHPDVEPHIEPQESRSSFSIGDEVWVKPAAVKCTTQWEKGNVSKINSKNNVEVNGVPRRVLDLRQVVVNPEADDLESHPLPDDEDSAGERRYPQRLRRVPTWVEDYVL
ncbi:hypothetical protein EGW08_000310 [Elysia chlorotica]|uniref:Integrase catalytic domain-containing protein n=1 Tax=Elysia chlorotica TaxID=188477 RepID=A0A3S1AH33_ELYCH|nr:hypothetical protein EGW08_000310 [Elysia chlorotica]